jgi:predicted TIM-barrel fold metal-dependent hydrolase
MPEVRTLIKSGRLVFDSAASKYLYTSDIYKLMPTIVGDSSVCWGSDFPLRSQLNDLRDVKSNLSGTAYIEKFIGENAMKFLKIDSDV